jgi:hypothetical protein
MAVEEHEGTRGGEIIMGGRTVVRRIRGRKGGKTSKITRKEEMRTKFG